MNVVKHHRLQSDGVFNPDAAVPDWRWAMGQSPGTERRKRENRLHFGSCVHCACRNSLPALAKTTCFWLVPLHDASTCFLGGTHAN